MAIKFKGLSSVPLGTRTNTTFSIPSGIDNGDVLILVFLTRNQGEAVDPSGLTSASVGWNEHGSSPWSVTTASGVEAEMRLYSKTARNEPTTYTATHAESETQVVCLHYTGISTLDVSYDGGLSATGAGSTSTVPDNQSDRNPENFILWLGCDWADNANDRRPPSGDDPTFTERFDSQLLYVADGVKTQRGVIGVRSTTNQSSATNSWIAAMPNYRSERSDGGYLGTTGTTLEAQNTVPSATLKVPSTGYPVGTTLIALLGTEHVDPPVMSASDVRGNVWTLLQSAQTDPRELAGHLLTTKVTTALQPNDLITFTTSIPTYRWVITLSAFSDDLTPTTGAATNYNNSSVNDLLVQLNTTAPNSLVFGGHVVDPNSVGVQAIDVDANACQTWPLYTPYPAGTFDYVQVTGQYQYVGPGLFNFRARQRGVSGSAVTLAHAFTTSLPPAESQSPIQLRSYTSVPRALRTNTVVDYPAGVQPSDRLYLVFTSENLTEAVDPSVGSSGWELITSALGATVAGTEMETRVYGKNHYGEASSLTLTHAESTTQAVMVAYSGAANLRGVTWLTQTGTGTSSTLANTQIEVPNGKAVSFSWDWGDGGRARIPPSGYTARFDSERLYVVDSPMRYVGQTTARALTNNSLATSPWGTWHGSLDPQLRVGGHVNTTGAIRSGSSTTGTCVVPPGGYPVGINLFALISTSHAAATTMTASDPGGNTWNMVQSTTNTVGGISLYLLWTKVTTALTEGQVITFTSGTAATKFAVNLSAFTGNLIPTTGTANNYNNTTGVGANNTLTSGMVTTTADQSLLIGGHGHVSSTLVVLPSDGGIGTFRVSTFGGSDRVAQGQYKYVGPGTTDLHADAVSNGTFVSLAQAFEVGPDTVPTTPVPPGEAIEPNPSYAYAAGRDYGFYLDKNGELKVFGALWSYNLPQSDGQPYLGNKAVIAVEEPEEGGVRPQAGGFMLGYEGHVIGIGYYDQDYWRGFPPDEQQDTPELQITEGVSGYTAIAGSSQMGTWALDSVGQPQLVYISPLATNYTAILAGVFPRPKPSGSGYVGIAVGSNNVYLLDAAGGLSAFGFGLPPAGGAGPSGGKWIKVVASATHYGVLSDQGQIYWDIEVPGDNATIAAIQAPPTEKIFADVAVGYHHTYALLNASQTAPGQVYGYGTPWNTNIGEHTVLTNPGHTGIGAGPPVGTWGFAVVSETDTRPFGLTVFGPDAPDIPPATSAPGAPNNFRVINYNGSTDTGGTHNTVTLEWERPLSGQMPAWYEITYTPMTEGAPPTSPPIGSVIATVPDNGEVRQTATIELPAGLHGPMYYMIRSIGQGGVSAGGASFWVLTTYDNTLLLGDWRKVRVTLVDYSCDQGGYVIMFEIDEIVGGTDGWTGAQIDFDMIPEGTFYFPVNSKVSVARQFGPCIAGRPTTAFHIAGLEHITVPPSPQNIVKVIIDYSICVEDGYAYWVHDDSQSIQSGNENRIDVPPLYEHCKTMMPKVQYLRDLHSPFVVSDFCLGALDSFQYDIRSGVFSVLGRPAPVVVVDSRSTASGQLIFINQGSGAEGRSALLALQDLFRSGHPMLLQVLSDYEVGHGELYFQPTSINDRWIGPDARRPEHALEVNFIEIDPPKGQVILYQIGIPLSAEPGTELVKTPEYVDWPGDTNPLFGMRFCEGGLKERYDTCDGVLYKDMTTGTKRTCNEVFHSPEMTTC